MLAGGVISYRGRGRGMAEIIGKFLINPLFSHAFLSLFTYNSVQNK
jgi:hypothetical protein